MWISRVKVHRFGAFQDLSLPDFQPGLNLLYGPNESGKTTIMMFLRAMLFGFESKGRASVFVPLDGAEPGGSLALRDSQGQEWLLERWGLGKKARITVSGPGGVSPGEGACQTLIQHVSRTVYENIFAFGLEELASIESLNQQEVKELLYSASLGLKISLAAVERGLKEESKKLFNPKKQAKSEIRLILEELAQVRQELRHLEGQPQEYQELCQELGRVLKEIADLEGQTRQTEEKLVWLKKLSQAWPVWESWHLTRAALQDLPAITDFPEDGLARLEVIKAHLVQVEEQLKELQEGLAQAHQEAAVPTPEARLLEMESALESLWEERVLWEDRRRQLQHREKEVAASQARLSATLAQLGPGWEEDRLAGFPLSLSRRYEIQNWRQRWEEAGHLCRQGEERLQTCRAALAEKEVVLEEGRTSGSASGEEGWAFRWGFWVLGGVLALAASAAYLKGYAHLAGTLGMGGGMALLAALAILFYLRADRHRRWQQLEEERQRAAAALAQAQTSLAQGQARLHRLREEWHAWLETAGLPGELSPGAALDLLNEVEKAQGLLQECRAGQRVCQDLEKELEDFTRRLAEVLHCVGAPAVSREEVNATLIRLKQELAEARQAQEEKQRGLEKMAALKKELAKWQAVGARLQEDRRNLLAAAGVAEEEAFRQRAQLYQRRRELLGRERELTEKMRLVAGGEEELKRLKADLAQTTGEDLQAQLAQTQRTLAELEGRLVRLREEKVRLEEQRQKLEQAEELGRTLLREQTLATRLREAAWGWTISILAGHFLEQGRRRFEAEYQPQVFQQAGHYFALLTKGKYLKVVAPLEGEKFFVITRQGQHTPVEHLSRGTVEQLYLALRFALIKAYSQGGRNLPLILDDILVNFDQERARQAVRLFQEMSRSHQILLFTCHPHLVNLVQEVLGSETPGPINLH